MGRITAFVRGIGLTFILVDIIMFLTIFVTAWLNPMKGTMFFIDRFGEANTEMAITIISIPFILFVVGSEFWRCIEDARDNHRRS